MTIVSVKCGVQIAGRRRGQQFVVDHFEKKTDAESKRSLKDGGIDIESASLSLLQGTQTLT